MTAELTNTGLPFLENVPRGTHLCQFYETGQDLLDVLVPYFKAGLDNDELCLWITSDPLVEGDAREAMTRAVPGFERYLRRRQMAIVPSTAWYRPDGSFTPRGALEAGRRITAVAEKRYMGLRVSGSAGLLCKRGLIEEQKALAICSHPLARCGVWESLDLMAHHQLALVKRGGAWQVVENSAQAGLGAALKETAQRYSTLFENSPDGMQVVDGSTGRIAAANQAAARIFGFDDPADMVGIDPMDFITPEDKERVAGMIIGDVLEKDAHRSVELRVIRRDGATVWVSAVGVRTEYHGRPASLVSLMDVTDRKQTQRAFEDSERRYRLLAENTSDVIWVTDLELRPVYFSPSVTRLLGYSVAEALEGSVETMLTADSRRRATAAFREVMAAELTQPGARPETGELELQFKHKDGSLVWVDATVGLLRDSGGHPMQILGVLHDISRRKAAEERLQHSLGMLERTVESAIQAIASTVATKDIYTAGHQRRVTQLACAIAQEMGLPAESCHVIRTAGLLHDLGKISLPTDILTKPGQLTHLEMAVIRTHPQVAYDVLKRIESFDRIALVVLQHHERMDGSGYPFGLRGDDILLEARVLAVSDVIEAMYSYRPYRPALGLDKALDEVSRNSGTLYDAQVVDSCLRVFHRDGFRFGE